MSTTKMKRKKNFSLKRELEKLAGPTRRGWLPCATCGMKGGVCCNGKGWIPVIY